MTNTKKYRVTTIYSITAYDDGAEQLIELGIPITLDEQQEFEVELTELAAAAVLANRSVRSVEAL